MDRLLMNIISFLFSKHRHIVFTTFKEEQYFKMIHKLDNHGVSHRTKVSSMDAGGMYSGRGSMNQYDIYVKKEDVHLAEQAIHSEP